MSDNPRLTSINREQWARIALDKRGRPDSEMIKALERLVDDVFRVFPGMFQEAELEAGAAAVRAIGVASGLVSAAADDAAQDLGLLMGRLAAVTADMEDLRLAIMPQRIPTAMEDDPSPRFYAVPEQDIDGAAYSLASLALSIASSANGAAITALTGDGTATGPGSVPFTLATVNANVGSWGSASSVATFTVNGKGLITAAANVAISVTSGSVTDFTEAAQDAVGAALTDTATIDFIYNDGAGTITAAVVLLSITDAYISATAAIDATKIGGGAVSNTEFGYLDGVTSAIQTQIDGKEPTITVLVATKGGTGQSSYAVGDLLYASTTTALSKLADVATGNALISGGVGVAPSYGKIGLTTHVSGTLAEGNGGTNQTTYAQGDLLYASAANTLAKLAKDTGSTRYLSNTGASNAPAWAQVALATGVSGTLPAANGGTGQSSYAVGDLLYASGSAALSKLAAVATGNVLRSGGVTTAPAWGPVALTTDVSGILPAANGGQDTQPLVDQGGMNFNGTTTYLDGNGLTGASDSKLVTVSIHIRFANAASATEIIFSESGNSFRVDRNASGNIIVTGKDGAGSTNLSIVTTGTPCSAAGTYRIRISIDMADSSTAQIRVNGTAYGPTITTFVNSAIDFTASDYAVGASNAGASFFTGDIYSLLIDPGVKIDWSDASKERVMADVNGVPNFVGGRGELLSGSQPWLFLAYGKSDSWWVNRGYGAGNFTRNGTIADAATAINGRYAASRKGYMPPYRTTETTLTLAVGVFYVFTGSGAATWTLPAVAGNHGERVRCKNAGSANVTIQRAGSDNIYDTSSVTSITMAAGTAYELIDDSSVWQVA